MHNPENIATIAILDTKLDGAITEISELKRRFDIFQASFVRDDLYNIKHEEHTRQIAINTRDIQYLTKNQSHNVSWVWPVITFIFGGVILFLINYALTH